MNLNLKGKNALVCGSSKGIGKAIAIELAELGASVTLVARSEEVLKANLEELAKNENQQHDYLVADFSVPEQLKEALKEHLVNRKIPYQILINNTGGPPGGLISEAEETAFLDAFNLHLISNHVLTTALIPSMKTAGYGRIVNVISTSVKAPLKGLGVSNTIRGAVANWSKTMANELGQFGITVNNVLPGATATGRLSNIIENKANKSGQNIESTENAMKAQIPLGRFGNPQEIAAGAAFLCTPAAAYITGTNLVIDGGRTASL